MSGVGGDEVVLNVGLLAEGPVGQDRGVYRVVGFQRRDSSMDEPPRDGALVCLNLGRSVAER